MSDFGAKVSHKYSLSSSRKSPYPTQKGFSIRPPLFCGISKTGTQDISHSPLEIPFFFTHSQEMSEFWCLRAISVYSDQHMRRNVLQVLHSELWTSHTDEFIVIYTTNSASLSWQKNQHLYSLISKCKLSLFSSLTSFLAYKEQLRLHDKNVFHFLAFVVSKCYGFTPLRLVSPQHFEHCDDAYSLSDKSACRPH